MKQDEALTPEERRRQEREDDRMRDLLNGDFEREEEAADTSRWRELLRSKQFWYGVFGFLFVVYMVGLILWVYHDLQKH